MAIKILKIVTFEVGTYYFWAFDLQKFIMDCLVIRIVLYQNFPQNSVHSAHP